MINIFSPVTDSLGYIGGYFVCLAASLLCGLLAALAASKRSYISRSFFSALLLLPAIVQTVITMVNGNIGTGVAVMGAFSLIRFRSVPGKARDIVSIFFCMTAGLACAAGYVALAIIFTALISVITVLLSSVSFAPSRTKDLRITIPETLEFTGEFDDLFEKYTVFHQLLSTKTSNMGSMYKLLYRVRLKSDSEAKAFIDDLRCRNGNLEISLSESAEGSDEL